MESTFLIITSIAKQDHPALIQYSKESAANNVFFILIGDKKSPKDFNLLGCDYYSTERQQTLSLELAKVLPFEHYSRKNLGYLVAMSHRADKIIETDDDNYPLSNFWNNRTRQVNAHLLIDKGWVNIFKYFTQANIWPRGFSLENINDKLPELNEITTVECPIQQGLIDVNPDVDAIYRLILPLPINFDKSHNIALGKNSFCPFNSQNTTWFKEAFQLLYLPSYCSFRMTDIWRSFVAQRIAWTCDWSILFHNSTVWQKRNDHNLLCDFRDEVPGYYHNAQICISLRNLNLKKGRENIGINMVKCYQMLIDSGYIGQNESVLLNAWLKDINSLINK
jgi:hypothetical protein